MSNNPAISLAAFADSKQKEVFTPELLNFLVELHRRFGEERLRLLAAREARKIRLDQGEKPKFLPETKHIREGNWKITGNPADLADRKVEITGPVDRKMIINALNSGARVFMADFEDSNTPTWHNQIDGQINLYDAVRRTITYKDAKTNKYYELVKNPAVLMVRPRGWHMDERHVTIDGKPMSGSLFDFGVFVFRNGKELVARGSGPYFYLPKMESHLEARLWAQVLDFAEDHVGLKRGTIRATVLIETILAAYEMDEILYELREHSAGLNCGRWDYIFSFIKKFRNDPKMVMPDRSQVTMTAPFLSAYVRLLIQTCHKRGVHAMGGMAAQIPIKDNPEANEAAMQKVRADKNREASLGHDGTWVAHPGMVGLALAEFDAVFTGPNQLNRPISNDVITEADLIAIPAGDFTEKGLRHNIDVSIGYLESWIRGIGCVPLHNLMEDAATAEISRTQVWQWLHHQVKIEGGRVVTFPMIQTMVKDYLAATEKSLGSDKFNALRYKDAAAIFEKLVSSPDLVDFLTTPAYDAVK
ncbi:MAG: malate synthase A [Alphaproteobacteria bacterium]|nr:malate synthase A [Alphaproteobacteria bacterium]